MKSQQDQWRRDAERPVIKTTDAISNPNGPFARSDSTPGKAKVSKRLQDFLKIGSNERNIHRDFLKADKSYIFKIWDNSCSFSSTSNNNAEACDNSFEFGPGSEYSFRKKEQNDQHLSDLKFVRGSFVVGGQNVVVSIISDLGDININQTDLTHPKVRELLGFPYGKNLGEITDQFLGLRDGLKIGDSVFYNSSEAFLNHTYIVRLISYHHPLNKSSRENRVDMILCFRVIDKNADGFSTVIWRELSRKDSPALSD